MNPRIRPIRPRICNIPGFKCYNYLLLVYIEDLDANGLTYGDLLKFLDGLAVKCACSPIHDRDTWSADDVWHYCERHIDPETGDLDEHYLDRAPYVGKPKKPHVHLLFKNKSAKSVKEMEALFCLIEVRPTMWEQAYDPDGSIRYFAHMDSPEKAYYSPFNIHGFGGISLDCLLNNESKSRMFECKNLIMALISEKKIFYIHELYNYIYSYEDLEMLACYFGNVQLFRSVLFDRRQQKADNAAAEERRKKREEERRRKREGLIG